MTFIARSRKYLLLVAAQFLSIISTCHSPPCDFTHVRTLRTYVYVHASVVETVLDNVDNDFQILMKFLEHVEHVGTVIPGTILEESVSCIPIPEASR